MRPILATAAAIALLAPSPCAAQARPILERREVRADGHPLSVWSKRPPTAARGSILLVHGRTWSARPNFDLQVPGSRQDMSLMDALVARGYAVYALDQRGYGGTPRDRTGWLTPDRAEQDVSVVLSWIVERERTGSGPRGGAESATRPVLLGYSRGAQVAMLVAQRHPEQLAGLVLYGYPDPGAAGAPPAPPDPAVPAREHTTAAAAGEDFISPAVTPPGVKDAYVRTATTTDSIRADWRLESQFSVLDPALVRVPTLLLDGERDPYANASNHPAVFAHLRTADRWWVVLPGADHAAHLELQAEFVNALVAFMERR
jgi:pimeloyl-ACP methyl ester carboxylesterase